MLLISKVRCANLFSIGTIIHTPQAQHQHPRPQGWGYRNEARLRGLVTPPHPHPQGWGYRNEARLRGLPILVTILSIILAAAPAWCQPQPPSDLDLSPEIIESSPVLQRWQRQVPSVWSDIKHDPSFPTRLRLGYSLFPDSDAAAGFHFGLEDLFIGRTGLTVSADYRTGDRTAYGTDLRYYLRPLGSYINIAPVVGYRYLETDGDVRDGINLGLRLLLVPSRGGGADIALTQSFVSPGSSGAEVGITTLSFGYALTPHLRLSTDIQQQNAPSHKDSRFGILLEWMP